MPQIKSLQLGTNRSTLQHHWAPQPINEPMPPIPFHPDRQQLHHTPPKGELSKSCYTYPPWSSMQGRPSMETTAIRDWLPPLSPSSFDRNRAPDSSLIRCPNPPPTDPNHNFRPPPSYLLPTCRPRRAQASSRETPSSAATRPSSTTGRRARCSASSGCSLKGASYGTYVGAMARVLLKDRPEAVGGTSVKWRFGLCPILRTVSYLYVYLAAVDCWSHFLSCTPRA